MNRRMTLSYIVRAKPIRDVVTIGQHWRNNHTDLPIYIVQVYRHERRVRAIFWNALGSQTGTNYLSFHDLDNRYHLMGPVPHAAG